MSHSWCSALPLGVRLAVQITPNARKTEVVGVQDDVLKLKLAAQPIDGRANEALIKYLAKTLAVPRGAVTITHGQTARRKLIEIAAPALGVDTVVSLLLPAH